MGCDIHLVLEQKTKHGWVGLYEMGHLHLGPLEPLYDLSNNPSGLFRWKLKSRDYRFFYALVGIRGPYEDVQEGHARGLPDDLSSLSNYFLSDEDDLHSHSWLSVQEMMKVIIDVKLGGEVPHVVANKLLGLSPTNLCHEWIGDFNEDEIDSLRIVFAFDN